jgi:hypothetical protein
LRSQIKRRVVAARSDSEHRLGACRKRQAAFRPADQVIDDALAWLDALGTRAFFLWVHLYDPHANQTLPDAFRARFAGDPYAGAIAFADAQVGRLLDRLDQRRTAIVVAGDHGESLGDHGEEEHGIFLYESTLHVPLIIRAPQIDPHRVSALISLVDVAPTILDLMHLEAPRLDGRSLLPLLKNRGALPERVVYAESMYARRFGWSPLRVLRDERFKLIDAPRPELYDLDVDPFEAHNLAIERPIVGAPCEAALEQCSGTGTTEPALEERSCRRLISVCSWRSDTYRAVLQLPRPWGATRRTS